jgi:hypothetical protein
MAQKLPDVWTSRDYPVLLAIAEAVDRGDWVRIQYIAEKTGLSVDDCYRAVVALDANGYLVTPSFTSGRNVTIGHISPAAYRVTGLHPDPAEAVQSLVHVLDQAAATVSDPSEKSKLKAAAGAIGELAGTAAGTFLAAYAAKITGLS